MADGFPSLPTLRRVADWSPLLLLGLAITACHSRGSQPGEVVSQRAWIDSGTNFVGLTTNGPAVLALYTYPRTNISRNPFYSRIDPAKLDTNKIPPEVVERIRARQQPEFLTNVVSLTNSVFERFLPESLNYLIWTRLTASTNGRNIALWSTRMHPPGWPTNAPVVKWNPNCVAWGMRGLTALSPCWQQEGSSGQVPITALTRRHGYARGHGMGPPGFRTNYAGKKVWFLGTNNVLVEMKIAREVVRTASGGKGDYTIVLFTRDLPQSIEPLRVVAVTNIQTRYKSIRNAPHPMFATEQGGNISTGLPGLSAGIYKGGDSGSPNLLPMPGELVFHSGRTTSGPNAQMQEDMDALCTLEGLNPRNYQLQWVDLSGYPAY